MASAIESKIHWTHWAERYTGPGFWTITHIIVMGPRLRDQYGVIHFVGGV